MLNDIKSLWDTKDEMAWKNALDYYWRLIKPEYESLEKEMEQLSPSHLITLGAEEWYNFLLNKYFKWKYTAPNRYESTTKKLRWYKNNNRFDDLLRIRDQTFKLAESGNVSKSLSTLMGRTGGIKGLGTAGASGLLALLFPKEYGTVDQFVVKSLCKIDSLPERNLLLCINPEVLNLTEGVLLIKIMKRKSDELNNIFVTNFWSPRKIDKILWSIER